MGANTVCQYFKSQIAGASIDGYQIEPHIAPWPGGAVTTVTPPRCYILPAKVTEHRISANGTQGVRNLLYNPLDFALRQTVAPTESDIEGFPELVDAFCHFLRVAPCNPVGVSAELIDPADSSNGSYLVGVAEPVRDLGASVGLSVEYRYPRSVLTAAPATLVCIVHCVVLEQINP